MKERTASGPNGNNENVPPEPLGGVVIIEIPPDLAGKMRALRWWIEEEQRAVENFLWDRAEAIRRELIKSSGLLYTLEYDIERLVALMTGVSAKT